MKYVEEMTYKNTSSCYNQNDGEDNSNQLFDNLPEILRPRKAASILGLKVSTIYDWSYRGQMRNVPRDLFLKRNKSLYIRTEVLKRWVTTN